MTPSTTVITALAAAMGATTVTFAPVLAPALWVLPIKTDFTQDPTTSLVNADIANFDGSVGKAIAAGARVPAVDPVSGDLVLNLPAPIGGFVWTTTGVTALPMTVYGVALSDDSATLTGHYQACQRLDTPVELDASGQIIEIGPQSVRVAQSAFN